MQADAAETSTFTFREAANVVREETALPLGAFRRPGTVRRRDSEETEVCWRQK